MDFKPEYVVTQLIPSGYRAYIKLSPASTVECEHKKLGQALEWMANTVREAGLPMLITDEIQYFGISVALDVVVTMPLPNPLV
jgi:hypothetical protein